MPEVSSQTKKSANEKSILDKINAPPHSIEAERAVLGCLLLDPQAWDKVAELVSRVDFYRKEHRTIFEAMEKLAKEGSELDVVMVGELMERMGLIDAIGGLSYLAGLAQNTPSVANIAAYAKIVREKAIVRELIAAAHEIAQQGYEPDGRTTSELLDFAESKVFKIAEQRESNDSGPVDLKSVLHNTLAKIEELFENDEAITGLSTGFNDLDEMTSGLQSSDLVIVAGRPSMGKTTFSMNLAENVAMSSGKPVLVFSMEMPAESIVMRMLSSLGRINQTKIRSGKLDDDDWPRLTSTMSMLLDRAKVFIDDTPGLSPQEMRSRSRRVAREQGEIGMIVVDYLQLMQVPGLNENRTAEISEISRSLKGLAKELSCPVVALSQLNRSLEQRADRRPVMSDLRESGAIEQDADLIMFVYRDEVYNDDSPDKGTAEIIIGKQRNGPIGKIRLTFQGQYTRFDNFTPGPDFEESY